mgnify:CR=1 FL=1
MVDFLASVNGGVTAAQGFEAAGVYAGIKKVKKDMAIVYSNTPAVVAGTFTTNVVKAAPVVWDMKLIKEQDSVHAIVLNSGVANACTGEIGVQYNEQMATAMAEALGTDKNKVLTASTGVIGKQLPIEKIVAGTKLLAESKNDSIENGTLAAQAIMTTDTVKKEIAVSFELDGKTIVVGGMSKGSGMIHPNMATMLGVITTDLAISKQVLQTALSKVILDTFNMISVDRDTSTNDSLVCMANGLAGNEEITSVESEGYKKFYAALEEVTTYLAKEMAGDGEGATKLLEVTVVNASTDQGARALAKSVITSNLVKSAVFGSDANWGRILCALGYSGETFDPYKVDITIESENGKLQLVENGMATDYSEEFATEILKGKKVTVICDMKDGNFKATAWGCDLTYDYVKINGDYRS